MKKNEQGVAHLFLILLLVVVLGGIGFAGYRIMKSKQAKPETPATANPTPKTETTDEKSKAWLENGYAVKGTFADADVVQVSDKQWRLYYATQPEVQGHNFEVYSAVSSDGKSWTQESGVRKTMATFPEVIKLADGTYRMYFQNAGVISSAISTDGLNFVDEPGTRIDKTNDQGLIFDNVAAPTIIKQDDGQFVMVYRGTINARYAENTPNPTTQLLFWATSPDGLVFTKKGIAVDSRDTILNGQLDGPDIVKWDDGKYRVFATSYTGVYEFSFDGKVFGEPNLALAGEAKKTDMGFTGAPPGDPTVINILGTWFMYYGGTQSKSGIHYATYE